MAVGSLHIAGAGLETIVLGGGCFQNRLLTERVTDLLVRDGFRVLTHRRVPPGDGGLAVGQIWAATLRLLQDEVGAKPYSSGQINDARGFRLAVPGRVSLASPPFPQPAPAECSMRAGRTDFENVWVSAIRVILSGLPDSLFDLLRRQSACLPGLVHHLS